MYILGSLTCSLLTSEFQVQTLHLFPCAGVGPFTAANMLQLLGHYSRIPCDSETVRHLHKMHKLTSCSLANVQQHAQQANSQLHALLPIAHRGFLSSDLQLLFFRNVRAVALRTLSAFVIVKLLAVPFFLLLSDLVAPARQVYARYAPYQFLAYWHELWRDYESLVGPFASLDPQCYPLLTGLAICP